MVGAAFVLSAHGCRRSSRARPGPVSLWWRLFPRKVGRLLAMEPAIVGPAPWSGGAGWKWSQGKERQIQEEEETFYFVFVFCFGLLSCKCTKKQEALWWEAAGSERGALRLIHSRSWRAKRVPATGWDPKNQRRSAPFHAFEPKSRKTEADKGAEMEQFTPKTKKLLQAQTRILTSEEVCKRILTDEAASWEDVHVQLNNSSASNIKTLCGQLCEQTPRTKAECIGKIVDALQDHDWRCEPDRGGYPQRIIGKPSRGHMVDWGMAIQLHTETWILLCLFCGISGFCLGLAVGSCGSFWLPPPLGRAVRYLQALKTIGWDVFMLDPGAHKYPLGYSDLWHLSPCMEIFLSQFKREPDQGRLVHTCSQNPSIFPVPSPGNPESFVPVRRALAIFTTAFRFFGCAAACL